MHEANLHTEYTRPYGILKDFNKTSLRITIRMCLTTKKTTIEPLPRHTVAVAN